MLVFVGLLALLCGCQAPTLHSSQSSANLSFTFVMDGSVAPATEKASVPARLLLPSQATLTVSLTAVNGSKTASQTVAISGGQQTVATSFDDIPWGTYTVNAQTMDSSGTVQFQQTAPLLVTETTAPVTLALVPAVNSSSSVLISGHVTTGTLAPNSTQSWVVPASTLVNGGYTLALTADPSILIYAQDLAGNLLSGAPTVHNLSIPSGSASSFLTIYNPSTTTAQPFSVWMPTNVGGTTTVTPPSAYVVGISGPTWVAYGASGSFVSTYNGVASSYQWLLNGTAISGANLANLTLTVGTSVPFGTNLITLNVTDANGVIYSSSANFIATTQWAASVNPATSTSNFSAVAVDASGNSYAGGWIKQNSAVGFGNGITATGGNASGQNAVLVKYNGAGTAQWSQTTATGAPATGFTATAVDNSGNIVAAGWIGSGGTANFGTSTTVSAPAAGALMVKYNSNGTATWAQADNSTLASEYLGVATDSSGNIYAVGYFGAGTDTFASGVSVTATNSVNAMLVKYNSAGTAQWAQTLSGGSGNSGYNAVAVDGAGNVYVAGYVTGPAAVTFGGSITATPPYSGSNSVIVKYTSAGAAVWAQTPTSSFGSTSFTGVAVDAAGDTFAVGSLSGNYTCSFSSTVSTAGGGGTISPVIVAYSPAGVASWAQEATGATGSAWFTAITVDGSGNLYAVGQIDNTGTYTFGTNATATTSSTMEVVLVKYSTAGIATSDVVVSGLQSTFNGLGVDTLGIVYAVGNLGTGAYGFGGGFTISGAATTNAFMTRFVPGAQLF